MSKELTTGEKCVLVRGGLEFWVSADRVRKLEEALKSNSAPRFIEIGGQFINTFEITGIFTPEAVEEKRRRANGQWICKLGTWHEKTDACECVSPEQKRLADEFYQQNGYYPRQVQHHGRSN